MQTNVAAGTMAQPGGVVMTGQPGGAPITPEMEEATTAYLEQLKAMTEMLSRCTEQAQSVSQDTEQMNNLSKNLAGINAIYEMQLRAMPSGQNPMPRLQRTIGRIWSVVATSISGENRRWFL